MGGEFPEYLNGSLSKTADSRLLRVTLILFSLGTVGVIYSAYSYQRLAAECLFVVSSLLLGVCLLSFLFFRNESTRMKTGYLTVLFLASIVKVIGVHVKYGLFLGCDALSEYRIIDYAIVNGSLLPSSGLAEFPLSMIGVSVLSLTAGPPPIYGVWNTIHLVTAALIPVFVYLIFNHHFSHKVSLLASLFVAYHPTNTIYGMSMTRENLAILMLCVAVYVVSLQMKGRSAPEHVPLFLLATLGLVGSHYASAYYGVLVLLLLGICSYAVYVFRRRKGVKIFYVVIPVVILLLWWSNTIIHLFDVRIGYDFLVNMWDFLTFQSPVMTEPAHYEIAWITSQYSLPMIMYLVQSFVLLVGSLYLVVTGVRKKLSDNQITLAFLAVVLVGLNGLWFLVPELGGTLNISRILRFTILFNSLAAGAFIGFFVTRRHKRRTFRHASKILVSCLVLLILVLPITSELTKYIGFTKGNYPAELEMETYNIRSIDEVLLLGFVGTVAPNGTQIVLEYPLRNTLALYPSMNFSSMPLDKDLLFLPHQNGDFLILRRSLLEFGEYVHYPVDWQFVGPYVDTLSDEEITRLKGAVLRIDVVYDKGFYKIWHR